MEVEAEGWKEVDVSGEIRSEWTSDAAGPAAGCLPSLKALAMSAAFHLEYFILASVYTRVSTIAA